jgi:uncharacterized DUF497 family protein
VDPKKEDTNVRKHGVSFDEAVSVFFILVGAIALAAAA